MALGKKFPEEYKGASDHWIGLHRESSEHPWMWMDSTLNTTTCTFSEQFSFCWELNSVHVPEASFDMMKTEPTTREFLQEGEMGKKFQEKHHKIFSFEFPVKLSCWRLVIPVIIIIVVVLCFALSVRKENLAIESPAPCYDNCPRDWIGFGSKYFYFSEGMRNWTFSQTFCMVLEAHLAQIDTLEELNFLKRYKGVSDHWIGLHRESSQHPWRWTDNTEYNNLRARIRCGTECNAGF